MNRILIDVNNISEVLLVYNQIKVYRADSIDGTYVEITDANTRITINIGKEQYYYTDLAGTPSNWYKSTYFNSDTLVESDIALSTPVQGGEVPQKFGYTFDNYSPPPGEWGEVYTADDMRYTMLWGIDSVGSDVAQSEWEDSQYQQIVREAVGEFEAYLTMDIARKKYVTRPDDKLIQARKWREGVDYTNEEDTYPFDPQLWNRYGFVQLRHWPIIKVTRAQWFSPVEGLIMDMVENKWLRIKKEFGQVKMFPTGGFTYGPYSVYGPLWTNNYSSKYPDGFQFDYETGYKNSDFVPEGLRTTIGKYAAIKALAAIGDGLLAGFSSQSVSLDGLSESFSSTQSATSAYFGARIKQYSDEIVAWLQRNRYKFSPIPIGQVT